MEKFIYLTTSLLLLCLFTLSTANAKQITVEQNDKKFIYNGIAANSINVKLGDEISFKNTDSVFHNIYSISKIMNFNLGAYGNGESASIVFDKPGTVKVQCAIHPRMMIDVKVDN